jgi:hypothetical protein
MPNSLEKQLDGQHRISNNVSTHAGSSARCSTSLAITVIGLCST